MFLKAFAPHWKRKSKIFSCTQCSKTSLEPSWRTWFLIFRFFATDGYGVVFQPEIWKGRPENGTIGKRQGAVPSCKWKMHLVFLLGIFRKGTVPFYFPGHALPLKKKGK
jgi:hypothetical protein